MQNYRNYIHLCFTGEKVEETMEDKMKKIADYYGIRHQIAKCKEELQELYNAISGYQLEPITEENRANIITEIADVEIMTAQLKYLLDFTEKEVENEKLYKINRQLKRMEREKKYVE